MKKRLIATRSDKNITEMTNITHPIIKAYAKKCDADFRILHNKNEIHPHYRILQLYDLFEEYNRILVLDSDILIFNTCPNIFEVVPEERIGSIFEDKGSRQQHRRNLIKEIQEERGSVGWTEGYINTGCFLCSKQHKEIFNVDQNKAWMKFGLDDLELGYHINRLGFEIQELPCFFNMMSMFVEPWSGLSKSDAFILHYAGQAFHIGVERIEQIYEDYLILKRYGLIDEIQVKE